MAKRQVFFSFHYSRDSWRASQVRNMGKVSDHQPSLIMIGRKFDIKLIQKLKNG